MSDSVEVITRRKYYAQKSRDIMQRSVIRMAWAKLESFHFIMAVLHSHCIQWSCALQT